MLFPVANHPEPNQGRVFPSLRLVERRARIDCWALQRAGALTPGAEAVITVNGERVAQLRALSGDRIIATIDGGETAIPLTWDMPMHRCPRLWFQCPSCHKRCRHVYLPELRCRRCLALEYSVQHLVQHSNAPRIAQLKRLRGNPQRRRARYWRLSVQIAQEEAKLAVSLRRFNAAVEDVRDGQQR